MDAIVISPDLPDFLQQLQDAPEGAHIYFFGTFDGLTIAPKSHQEYNGGTLKDCKIQLTPGLTGVRFEHSRFIRTATPGDIVTIQIPIFSGLSFINCHFFHGMTEDEVKHLENGLDSAGQVLDDQSDR